MQKRRANAGMLFETSSIFSSYHPNHWMSRDNARPRPPDHGPSPARPQKKRARLLDNFKKAAIDETAIEKRRVASEKRRVASENLFTFDYQGAAVIKRRANARMLFKAFVKVTYFSDSEPTEAQI